MRNFYVNKQANRLAQKSILFALITGLIFSHCDGLAQRAARQSAAPVANYDSLRTELEAMFDSDQNIRRIIMDSIGIDSPEAMKYFNEMASIDIKNRIRIATILDKYGWIEESRIGGKAAEAIFYVVQHSDLAFAEKYFPQFKELASRGEASRTKCATMEDRILMWKGKRQIYGTQASNNLRPEKLWVIWPIEDPVEVNELRKEAGFTTTVEENAKLLNAEYDPDEKLPPAKD